MIPTTRVFFTILFYITLCLAETDTYLQLITPETINVTNGNETINITISNVTNASLCNVLINVTEIYYDESQGAFYYYIPGEGYYYFETTENGPSSGTGNHNNHHDGGKSNGNDHDDHKHSRRHFTKSNSGSGRHGNDNDHSNDNTNNIANYDIFPLNFTIGNVTYCVNITSPSSSGNNNHNNDHDGGKPHDNDHDSSSGSSTNNDNDHDGGKPHDNDHDSSSGSSTTNDNDHDGGKPHDNDHDGGKPHDNDHDGHSHHGGHGHGNDNDHNNAPSSYTNPNSNPAPSSYTNPNPAPSSTSVININVTIVNATNHSVITTNITTNDTSGNIDSNVTVIVVPIGTTAIGNDPNNQFTDQWGNDARHAHIRDNLLNNRMQLENQLDNQIQGTNVERKTDVDITAQNNVIKITSMFLFPQGASEDAKKNTCNALANTAESFSNIIYTRDCDFTSMPQPNKRQAGDYVLISTYSNDENTNGGMALTLSIFATLIVFLSCNI